MTKGKICPRCGNHSFSNIETGWKCSRCGYEMYRKGEAEKVDISKRKSVRIKAEEYGTNSQVLNWILKSQGHLYGTPGKYNVTEKYTEYEHDIQNDFGKSYDPEFFEDLVITDHVIHKAEEELKEYRRAQKTARDIRQQNELSRPDRTEPTQGSWLLNLIQRILE